MVGEQEIWAKIGWTGAEITERAGAERLWGLSPGTSLNHHSWRKGTTVPTSFIDMTKTRVWQATRKVGGQAVGIWPGAAMEQEKQLSNSYRNLNTPRQLLKWKTSIFMRQQHLEVSPQLLPARSSLHRQQRGPCTAKVMQHLLQEALAHPETSQRATEAGVEDKSKGKALEKVLGFHAWEYWGKRPGWDL